jgi:hypothetical protein
MSSVSSCIDPYSSYLTNIGLFHVFNSSTPKIIQKLIGKYKNQAKKFIEVFKSIAMNFKYQLQHLKHNVVEIQT